MAEAPKYRPRAGSPGNISVAAPNISAGFSTLYQQLHQSNQRMEDQLDQAAEQEGEKAGALAGLDPKFRPTGDNTIRARAFDHAGLRVTLSRMENEVQAKGDAIWLANKDDPAALKKGLDQLQAETLAGMTGGLEILKPDAQLMLERQANAHMANAAQLSERRMADADKAAGIAFVDSNVKLMQSIAHAANKDPNATAAIAGQWAGFTERLLQYGPKGEFTFQGKTYPADPNRAGVFTAADIQQTLIDATEQIAESRVVGKWESAQSLGSMRSIRKGFEGDYNAGKLPFSLSQYERLSGMMDSDIRGKEAEGRAYAAAWGQSVDDQLRLAEHGYKPQVDLNTLAVQARANGRPDLAQRALEAKGLLDFQDAARRAPPVELERWIAADRKAHEASGWDPASAGRNELATKILGNMKETLKNDPLSWAKRAGVPVAELAFDKGGLPTVQSLRARFASADAAALTYGNRPAYLTETEAQTLSAALEAAPPDAAAAFLGRVAQASPDQKLPRFLEQLAKNSPALAQAGLLVADGRQSAAAHVLAGAQALKATEGSRQAAVRIDSDAKWAAKVEAPFMRAIGPNDGARGALVSAARAIYAARVSQGSEGGEQLYSDALQEAAGRHKRADGRDAGGFDLVNGNLVVLPTGLDRHETSRLIDGIRDADLAQASVNGAMPIDTRKKPIGAAAIAQAYPVTVGPGIYAFSSTDPATAVTLYPDDKGGLYTVDMRKLWGLDQKRPAHVVTLPAGPPATVPGLLQSNNR